MVKEITFYFIKHHYDLSKKDNTNVKQIVDVLYTESKKKELRTYIRKCLEETLQENYNSFIVNNILFEMFSNDDQIIKNRIIMELELYETENK